MKTSEDQIKADCVQAAKDMDARHDEELVRLEEQWRTAEMTRKFNKRSSVLLNQQIVEKRLLLIGDFAAADKVRRNNKRAEAEEVNDRFGEYHSHFELVRAQMLARHRKECGELSQSQDFDMKLFQKKKADAIEVVSKRVKSLQALLAEESQFEKFVARKFKKGPEFVLPMTVTTDGGDDIPPTGKSRIFLGVQEFRDRNSFGPLPLPTLKARPVRNPPRAFVARRKKDGDL
jgi:hypothetical protein